MKIISVVGARPNFIKIAPFARAIQQHKSQSGIKIDNIIVHTGQHYDDCMSETFFRQLKIPEANINLGVGSGSGLTAHLSTSCSHSTANTFSIRRINGIQCWSNGWIGGPSGPVVE